MDRFNHYHEILIDQPKRLHIIHINFHINNKRKIDDFPAGQFNVILDARSTIIDKIIVSCINNYRSVNQAFLHPAKAVQLLLRLVSSLLRLWECTEAVCLVL